jgi:hypothetical protein
MSYWDRRRTFDVLAGQTLTSVSGGIGDEQMDFVTDSGKQYRMLHCQDCCESVSVEDINGDLADLIGTPILFAVEESSGERPEGVENPDSYEPESQTWTFYRIGTIKGTVVIRWYGTSNGYYSESVDFEELESEEQPA